MKVRAWIHNGNCSLCRVALLIHTLNSEHFTIRGIAQVWTINKWRDQVGFKPRKYFINTNWNKIGRSCSLNNRRQPGLLKTVFYPEMLSWSEKSQLSIGGEMETMSPRFLAFNLPRHAGRVPLALGATFNKVTPGYFSLAATARKPQQLSLFLHISARVWGRRWSPHTSVQKGSTLKPW